ncbi:MAG: hypothetical protein VB042_05240 [Victivallaceae bacterium]|nr:hypothetical protein [Victivallaceae bacterium]
MMKNLVDFIISFGVFAAIVIFAGRTGVKIPWNILIAILGAWIGGYVSGCGR